MNFLAITGAQIYPTTYTDAEKTNLSFKRKEVHLTGFKRQSIIYSTVKVCLCLPGEKGMTSHTFAITDHEENILGYDIFKISLKITQQECLVIQTHKNSI